MKIFKLPISPAKTTSFKSEAMLDNRPQAIQQHKLIDSIQNTPIQRAAILVITEAKYLDDKRKTTMKNGAEAVSSKAPIKWFTVDETDHAPRAIKRVENIVDGDIGANDNIDIFGHSLSSMPGGVSHDAMTAKINEKFNIPATWAGSMRIFSCYGADGVGDQKYNVALAKSFSATHAGLRGVGGSTKKMELQPSKAGIYPISKAYTSVRNLEGIEGLKTIKSKITLLLPSSPQILKITTDIATATRDSSEERVTAMIKEWKAFYYNLPIFGEGWEVATRMRNGKWKSRDESLIGGGPGQVRSIKQVE